MSRRTNKICQPSGERWFFDEVSAMGDYQESYLGRLRKLVGNRKLITPGIRAIIRDDQGRVLFVRRSDNANWVLPAGGIELGESVYDCLIREVKEETGLIVISATPIAIYSESRFAFVNPYGQEQQMLDVVFSVDEWQGAVSRATDETCDARFFSENELDTVDEIFRETLNDFQNYDGKLILK